MQTDDMPDRGLLRAMKLVAKTMLRGTLWLVAAGCLAAVVRLGLLARAASHSTEQVAWLSGVSLFTKDGRGIGRHQLKLAGRGVGECRLIALDEARALYMGGTGPLIITDGDTSLAKVLVRPHPEAVLGAAPTRHGVAIQGTWRSPSAERAQLGVGLIDLPTGVCTMLPVDICGPCWPQSSGFAAADWSGTIWRFSESGVRQDRLWLGRPDWTVEAISLDGRSIVALWKGARAWRWWVFSQGAPPHELRVGLGVAIVAAGALGSGARFWLTTRYCLPFETGPSLLWLCDANGQKLRPVARLGADSMARIVVEDEGQTRALLRRLVEH